MINVTDDESHLKELEELRQVMWKWYSKLTHHYCQILLRPTQFTSISQSFNNEHRRRQPAVCVPCEILEDLKRRGLFMDQDNYSKNVYGFSLGNHGTCSEIWLGKRSQL